MNSTDTGEAVRPWWRAWWGYLASTEAAMDYSSTDYLLDRINLLDLEVMDLRAELEGMKAASIAR